VGRGAKWAVAPGHSSNGVQNNLTKIFMTITNTKVSMIKFDDRAKSSLSQHTFAILVVNLFRRY